GLNRKRGREVTSGGARRHAVDVDACLRGRYVQCWLNSYRGRLVMLDEYFGSSSTLQRNERVKLAAMFWNIVGAGMVIGGLPRAHHAMNPQASLCAPGRPPPLTPPVYRGRD